MAPPLVELREVTKVFGATRALDRVSFEVRAGEVHVLAGENGAGKSTLIKILSGVVTGFEGALLVNGERVHLRDARDSARHGIATIHQELSLVGSMTVAENLALPRPGALLGWVRRDDEERAAREVLAAMELDVDPRALVETLPLAVRQLLEIGRALARRARVLILDEPTSALSEPEAERLLSRVEQLAEAGSGIVYISHRMEESDRLAHRITVLRDGKVVACRPAGALPRDELVALMIGAGRDPATSPAPSLGTSPATSLATSPATSPPEGDLLTVKDLHATPLDGAPLRGVSFSLRRGEILGLAGLRGSGTSETLAALFGALGPGVVYTSITLGGAPLDVESPRRAIEQGLVLLANDRKKTVLPDLDVTENITLSTLPTAAPRGIVSLRSEDEIARRMTARLRVAAPSLRAEAGALSGGNQQKVALLRCLAASPRVLLLDEPTRGVDVGAKADIHRALKDLAAAGMGIVVVASEVPELLELCDRVVVLSRGQVAATLGKGDLTGEALRLALDADPASLSPRAPGNRARSAAS